MNDTYTRLRELFERCLEVPEGERPGWLEANVPDLTQRIELELMLAADSHEADFFRRDVASHIGRLGAHAEDGPRREEADGFVGRRFGPFELRRLLGSGGQGAVYLAERVGDDFQQTVAVKLLRRGIHVADEHRRFRREREILASFEHPGVARLIDGGVSHEGVPYLAMEYVDGRPIDAWCEEHKLQRDARLRLFSELCGVVSAAQRALIVHRDLKPSNVLVAQGAIKVLDFGIARLLDEGESPDRTHVPLMTPGYGAPEQATCGPITLSTDVYALGVLLRVLLTDESPAADPDFTQRPLPRDLQAELRWIIGKACAPEPERRYRDAAELDEDVRRFLAARPVLAHPPSRRYRLRKFVQRHRGSMLVTTAMLLGLLASLGVSLWQARVAREQAERAEVARAFLLSVFEAAKEHLPKDVRPTPDVLARTAARKLDADTRLAPALRAEFLGTLSTISFSSSDYAHAVEYADRSLATLDAAGDHGSRQHLAVEITRAEALSRLNRHEEADRALAQRMDRIREIDDGVAVEGVRVHAVTRRRTGHLADALELAREASERAARVYGSDSDVVEEAVLSYGFELSNSGRTKEAIALFEARRASWSTRHASPDHNYAALIENLAYLKNRVGDMQAAEALMREAVQLTRRIHEPPHEEIATAEHNLGVLLAGIGRYDEAEPLLQDAASMYEAVFGPDHSQTITALGVQGAVENKRGNYAAALPRLLRATSACTQAKLDSEPACAYNWHYLSLTYLKLGRLDEADAAIDRNVELRSKLYGDKNPEYAKALITKGDILIARGKAAEAIEVLDTAQGIFAGSGQAESLSGLNVLRARANALEASGRHAQALEVLDNATALAGRVAPRDEGRRLDLLAIRADALDHLGRHAEAREAARAGLQLQSSRSTIEAAQWKRLETLARPTP